jgi:hypothetical protein
MLPLTRRDSRRNIRNLRVCETREATGDMQDKEKGSRSRDVRADFSLGTPYHLLEEIERLQDLYGKLKAFASWITSVDAF